MSALDPSAPGLPLAGGGGGGGASVPAGSLGDVVVLGADNTLDAITREDLRADGRRPALPGFGLLWECNEASGAFVNTGTVGSSANLSTVGSGVSRSQIGPSSTLGRGSRFDGTVNGYAKGAAGVTPGTGSDTSLTMFVVAVIEAAPGVRKDILSRSFELAELPAPYVAATISVISSTSWIAKVGISGTYIEVTSDIPYTVGRQHIFGVTYDGTTVKLWLDGVLAKKETHAGAISWGTGTGLWWLGSNPVNAASTSLITRAGAANVVWTAAQWGEFVQRTTGNWLG